MTALITKYKFTKKIAVNSFLLIATLYFLMACTGGRRPKDKIGTGAESPIDTIQISSPADRIKPVVNVYIENSGSMDGYVKGVTEFEISIYSYLSDIKIAEIADSLNLFYINSKTIPQGSDIEDFIQKLEPSTFKQKGGDRGRSDIANVIKDVLLQTKENDISILVTDGIFSPGKGINASEYLANQQIGIKTQIADFLKREKNAAVIVYQLSSKFNGIYYNKRDAKIPLTAQRPFYLWIIGSSQHLVDLDRALPKSKFKGSGVQNVFSITSGSRQVKYAINPSIGRFKKSKTNTRTTIENLEKDSRTGKVKFAVNVDFSGLLLDETYLLNADNYENNSKYKLEIKPSVSVNKNYTHTLNFTSDKIYKGPVSVKLKMKRPDWVDEVNDDDGSTAAEGKTYGIKYQIDGVFEAFIFDDKNKYYTEIKININ